MVERERLFCAAVVLCDGGAFRAGGRARCSLQAHSSLSCWRPTQMLSTRHLS